MMNKRTRTAVGKTRLERSGFALWCLHILLIVPQSAQPTDLLLAPLQKLIIEYASELAQRHSCNKFFQMDVVKLEV